MSIASPQLPAFAIALLIQVPWDQQSRRHSLKLELVDADGGAVAVETANRSEPVVIEMPFEAVRRPGLKEGTLIDVPIVANVIGMPIPAGGHFQWRLSINGETREDWYLSFSTRPDQPHSLAA